MNINTTHHSAVIQLHNLPRDTKPRELCDWLWSVCGLAIQEQNVEVRPLEQPCANALVLVGRHELADYLDRLLCEQKFHGRQVVVRPKL